MFLHQHKYYKPSKDARILAILDSLAEDSGVSQSELGRRLHLSGAMVNLYLKELHDKKCIEYEAVNGKSFRYALTPEGELRRRRMLSAYSSEIIQIYAALKNLILEKVQYLSRKSIRKLALFGAAETCEVVLSALSEADVEILTLVDNDPAKQGKMFHGYVIAPPDILETIHCQGVLITSFGRQDEIYRQLLPLCLKKGLEIFKL